MYHFYISLSIVLSWSVLYRMVKISDPLMSKKYGHRTPPGLGFFRKGNYIKFDGKDINVWKLTKGSKR